MILSALRRVALVAVLTCATADAFAALKVKGEVFRERSDGLELIVSSAFFPTRSPSELQRDSLVLKPGDVWEHEIHVRNVSDVTMRVVTAPNFGFRELGGMFSYSCEPERFEDATVRLSPSRLDIVELKPGEVASLGDAHYTCGTKETGGMSFWYSIAKIIGAEYGVWGGSILCRAPFRFASDPQPAEPKMEEGKQGPTERGWTPPENREVHRRLGSTAASVGLGGSAEWMRPEDGFPFLPFRPSRKLSRMEVLRSHRCGCTRRSHCASHDRME